MTSRPRRRRTSLEVVLVDGQGRPAAAPGLAAWLSQIAPARTRGVVTVALAPDRQVRKLNRRFRGLDAATDVLSFPSGAHEWSGVRPASSARASLTRDRLLGEIVIATGIARRQAVAAGHSYQTELRVLALHGLLHLLGLDHEGRSGTMARVEYRLRRRGGLRDGLIERALNEDS